MDAITELLKDKPLIAVVVMLIVAIVWISRQWLKSLENERAGAAKSAAAIEATNIRLTAIEGWVQPRRGDGR